MPVRSVSSRLPGAMPSSRACIARHCQPQRAVQHRRSVIVKSSPNQSSTDVQTAESEQSREELQFLVQQLRSEVGALRTELDMVKSGRTGQAAPKPTTPATVAPEGTTSIQPGEEVSAEQMEAAIQWPAPGSKFWNSPPRDPVISLVDNSPPGQAQVPRDQITMNVVHVTAEMAPVAKVGGLGDVVQGLAKASAQRGNNVQVMLPFYTSIPEEAMVGRECVAEFDCPKGESWDGEMRATSLRTQVHRATIDGISVLLIAPADRDACNIFKGDRIYGGSYNELEAYLYFCRASLEALKVMGAHPDILHLHEWQCAAVSMLYWDVYYNTGFNSARVVLTIHNMDNSGECRQDEFAVTGVPGEMYADINKALDERTIGHNPERLNLLKGGMVYSNKITTVSPTYAEEARTGGAAGFLRTVLGEPHIGNKFSGVLNGIDTSFWCPSTDHMIPAPFNSQAPQGKALCKRFVQQGLGLKVDVTKPLAVCITRLVPQKGIHLIRHSVHHMAANDSQFVLLGSGHADGDFRGMAENEFKDSDSVRLMVMYSEPLAHMLYAAADFVLVPSLFEPCGLTQMIAMRYGALPIVRRTGGLADTVVDADEDAENGNGFVFDGADEGSCSAAIDTAIALFKNEPSKFDSISRKNMDSDMSWRQPAASYQELYRSAAMP